MKCKTGFKSKNNKCVKVKTKTKNIFSSKKKIKIGRPDRWEVLSIMLYGLFWYLFNDIVNMMSNDSLGWNAIGTPISGVKIPLISLLWISFLLFHIFLFIVVGRSIWKKDSTHHYYDLIAGMLVVLGVFLLLIPTVVMLMGFGPDYIMLWFFNLGRMTVYHIGVLIQVLGMIYFAVTK